MPGADETFRRPSLSEQAGDELEDIEFTNPSGDLLDENWEELVSTVEDKLKEGLPDPGDLPEPDGPEQQREKAPPSGPQKPRLIQRFPPDVVEMMQVELGKDKESLVSRKLLQGVRRRDSRGATACVSMPIEETGDILSEAYYSKANIVTVVVMGTEKGMQKFFSALRGLEIDRPDSGSCFLSRVRAGFDHVMYMVGISFKELDTFEAENILDRGMAAVVVAPENEIMFDIAVDSLSVAMVKYQRHRVFLLSDMDKMPGKLDSAAIAFSMPSECQLANCPIKKEELERLFYRVIASFSSLTVL
ncbi:MAG: hypothetical protein U5N86_03890 [Planctomycetota bacterium]|nr:hypothetical protein [Planctomycetota bacterium]